MKRMAKAVMRTRLSWVAMTVRVMLSRYLRRLSGLLSIDKSQMEMKPRPEWGRT